MAARTAALWWLLALAAVLGSQPATAQFGRRGGFGRRAGFGFASRRRPVIVAPLLVGAGAGSLAGRGRQPADRAAAALAPAPEPAPEPAAEALQLAPEAEPALVEPLAGEPAVDTLPALPGPAELAAQAQAEAQGAGNAQGGGRRLRQCAATASATSQSQSQDAVASAGELRASGAGALWAAGSSQQARLLAMLGSLLGSAPMPSSSRPLHLCFL